MSICTVAWWCKDVKTIFQEGVNSLFDITIPAIFSFHPLPTLFPSRGGIGWGDVLCSMPFAFSLEEGEAEPRDIGNDCQYE
jgi:hypothetical protein